ncbi:MAG: DHH family phosphoesterase [Candidatus Aenigmarchaeota archaeon]|nr:DHH family phosphoesterase [Candidatus Aenigmarchaeota archaeon]
MQRVISFLKKLTKKDEPLIIFHNDADGMCSAALMNRCLKYLIRKRADGISQPMPPEKNLMSKIKMCLPSKIIFVDLAIDQKKMFLKRLSNFCDILIIDHHPVINNMNSNRIIHFNPRFKKNVYQSASYLVYKICSRFIEFNHKRNLWIALVGAIGDYDLSASKDIIREAKNLYPEVITKIDDKSVRGSVFGQIAEMLTAGKAIGMRIEDLERIVEEAKTYKDVLSNEKLVNVYRKIHEEIENIIIDAKSKFDPNKKIFFYEIKTKYSLRATIATRLAEMWPDKVIVVWQKVRNKIRIASRNQGDRFDMGKLLNKAVQPGMKATFGGHPAAAGGVIDLKDWEDFKENLERLVEGLNQ